MNSDWLDSGRCALKDYKRSGRLVHKYPKPFYGIMEIMDELQFYFDTHMPKAAAVQLRQRGVEVVRSEEIGKANAEDVEHLEYATVHRLAIVTHDQDFLILDAAWKEQGKKHHGIFFVQQYLQGNVGQIVKQLLEYAELIKGEAGNLEEDIANQVTYIG